MRYPAFILKGSLIACVCLTTGCRPKTQVPSHQAEQEKHISNELMNINHYMVKRNQEMIENFITRTGWDMHSTGTGLWYMIIRHGHGPGVRDGETVFLSCRIFLLDGEAVDSSTSVHPESFVVGHGGVEAGLEEGVKYLHVGDSARFVLPPHLAHGNFGDSGKIPPGAILLYELKLLAVK